jgi:hypothetical protein
MEAGQAESALGQYSEPLSPDFGYFLSVIDKAAERFDLPSAQQQESKVSYSAKNKATEFSGDSRVRPSFNNDRMNSSPQAQDDLPPPPDKSRDRESPQGCILDTLAVDAKSGGSESDQWSLPPPSNPFSLPPPPTNIASRRRKVCHKLAALTVDTLRSTPVVKSTQRSSFLIDKFPQTFMEQNCYATQEPPSGPSLTAGSSLYSLDPPTPHREREMTLAGRESWRYTGSPIEGSMNFLFSTETGRFTTEVNQNLVSPSESPEARIVMYSSATHGPHKEKQWSFEIPDKPLFIPSHETIPLELSMLQPAYLTSTSQPVSSAFGHFNPNYMFESCSDNNNWPTSRSDQLATSRPVEKKTFQFSHTTPADFLEECKPRFSITKSDSVDRDEEPQRIKTERSSVLAAFDEGTSENDPMKVEEVKLTAETDCHPEGRHLEEDLSEDDSCASDETEHFDNLHLNSRNVLLGSPFDSQEEEQDNLVLPILDSMRQALVERIMDEFYLIFNQNWEAQITQCPAEYSSTSRGGKGSRKLVDNTSTPSSQQKRQRSQDEDSADESGSKKPRRRRGGPRPPSELDSLSRFACPFRKHDPQRYNIHSHRVCALTSWDTIARVK